MAGFENLEQAINIDAALQEIQPEKVEFVDPWTDEIALGIVVADVNAAIAYEQSKSISASMETADDLVRGYVRVRPWPNTDKSRSALSMPVVLEAIEKIMPTLHMSMWGSGKDPFKVAAVGKTPKEAAQAWQSILRWATRVSDLKEGSRLTLKNILQYGWGGGTYGFVSQEIEKRKYERVGDTIKKTAQPVTEVIAQPTYEALNIRNCGFDPNCPTHDPRKARFWFKRVTITAYDLDDMRDDDNYKNIPTRAELAEILARKEEPTKDSLQALKPNQTRELQAQQDTTAPSKDPLQQPLELVEYRTDDRVVTVLQRKIIIRNQKSDAGKCVVGCAFIDALNSMFGFGVARLLNGEQRLQQGVLNTWVDSLALTLNPAMQAIKSTLGNSQQNISIAPGKVITVDGELKALVTPDVSETAERALEASSVRAHRRIGAESATNAPTQALRTGSGVQAFQGDIKERMSYFMDYYLDIVFIPILMGFLELLKDNLDDKQIQQILTDETGKQYTGSDVLDVFNADVKLEIISGVKLSVRSAASQTAPLIVQMLQNAAVQDSLQVQATKFDYAWFSKEYLELQGWDINQLFVPMTPDDLKRAQEQNQAMSRAAGQMELQNKKHEDDLDSLDKKAADQATIATLRSHLKVEEQKGVDALEGVSNG